VALESLVFANVGIRRRLRLLETKTSDSGAHSHKNSHSVLMYMITRLGHSSSLFCSYDLCIDLLIPKKERDLLEFKYSVSQ